MTLLISSSWVFLSGKPKILVGKCRAWLSDGQPILAPAVTVGETEGAMDPASVFFFTSSFASNL